MGKGDTFFEAILNCKLIRYCERVVIWLKVRYSKKNAVHLEINVVKSEYGRPECRFLSDLF